MLDLDQGRTNLFAAVRGDKMTMRPFYKSLWPLVKDAGVGRAFSRVCMFVCLPVCLSVCPRSKRKSAWAINTKLSTRILHSNRSACIDPEVKRSKVWVTRYENRIGRTVANDDGRCFAPLCYLRPLPAWVCMSIRLPMFSSYYCFYTSHSMILMIIVNTASSFKTVMTMTGKRNFDN